MPELPEVETVRRGLAPIMTGKKIMSVTYRRANIRNILPPQLPAVAAGRVIVSVERHSKYIVIALRGAGKIIMHLGMSGRIMFADKKTYEPAKHDHVVIELAGGILVVFNDARRFGVFDYTATGAHALLDNAGPDALADTWDADTLYAAIHNRKTDMKAVLMNQKIIAGLGNIYVSEALHRAHITPRRRAHKVTRAECAALVTHIRAVLNDALAAGGSSLRDYVQADGELGYFQTRFRVYGRDGQPCRRCKTPIKRIVQAGRSTYYCSACQK